MNNIATFILARGGSQRIPKKNIMPFNRKPLIMWTVETAIAMGFPVYVFTDMKEIKKMMEDKPVVVREKMFESPTGEHRTGEELREYNKTIKADHIILLQPTSPLRDVLKIINWISEYIEGDYDVGLAAKKLERGFYYRSTFYYRRTTDLYNSDNRNYNSNVMEEIYKETGSFYIFKKEQIEKNHICNSSNKIIFPDPYNVDINTLEDFGK